MPSPFTFLLLYAVTGQFDISFGKTATLHFFPLVFFLLIDQFPLSPLQLVSQGLHLLVPALHLLQEAALHQPGDLIHGCLHYGLHHIRQLGVECDNEGLKIRHGALSVGLHGEFLSRRGNTEGKIEFRFFKCYIGYVYVSHGLLFVHLHFYERPFEVVGVSGYQDNKGKSWN